MPLMTTPPSLATSSLPDEVVTCLQNARFLHLATCADNTPHVSLMNYTYLPPTPDGPAPMVIMTSPASSRKTHNVAANARVSLLVHDWIAHRPPTLLAASTSPPPRRSPPPSPPPSDPAPPPAGSLAQLLLGINTAALGRISTTLHGMARLLAPDSQEEAWYKAQHLARNTFGPGGGGDEEAIRCYVHGDEMRVILVTIGGGRTADWKGQVRDWTLSSTTTDSQ